MPIQRQHQPPSTSSKRNKTLWIGGSSGLARTYAGVHGCDDLVLVGLEPEAPSWAATAGSTNAPQYCSCDLTNPASVTALLDQLHTLSSSCALDSMIVSVRAPLVTGNGRHEDLLGGLERLVEGTVQRFPIACILHVSSVAAVNHLNAQVQVNEDVRMPPFTTFSASYDVFKRKSEDMIETVCTNGARTKTNRGLRYTHLRVSALFSDTPQCIQCGALALQTRVGSFLPTKIDCNSSRNVAVAMRFLLERMKRAPMDSTRTSSPQLLPVYYYTRPSFLPVPVAYGEYLMEYRRAYDIHYTLWLPVWLVSGLVWLMNFLTTRTPLKCIPTCNCINYLLQVSAREHSFDNSKFLAHIPEIKNYEETIYECFVRRKQMLSKTRRFRNSDKKKA